MARLTFQEVSRVRNALYDDMQRQMVRWKLLAKFISPNLLKQNPDDQTYGQRKDEFIIDNQAGRSLRKFVSGYSNGATPRDREWFHLTVNNKSKTASSTAKRYFAQVEGILNSHFQVSNLYRVIPMSNKSLGTFSNSAYAMLPDPRYGFYFYPFAIGTYGFSCDAMGNPNMFYRDFSMTVRQIVDTYGEADKNGRPTFKNIPDQIKRKYEQAQYIDKFVLSNVVIHNPNYNPNKQSLDPADKKYQSYTFLQSSGGNLPPSESTGFRNENFGGKANDDKNSNHFFMRVSGYDYFPVIINRWEVSPEENWGVDGPGDMALADTMTLQSMERSRLKGVELLVQPPMVGAASLKRHGSSLLPGGITYVSDQEMNQHTFRPAFEFNPQLQALLETKAEYKQAVKECFFEDLFAYFGNDDKTHRTTREIDEKAAEKLALLSPALGQTDQDQNSKIIRNGQMILESQGRLPPRPNELKGDELTPEYISVLAQATKASLMNSQERFCNYVTSMAQATQDPTLLKIINAEAAVREYADYVAVDPIIVRDDDEFEEIKQVVAAQQAQQAQMMQQSQGAETAKNLSQAKLGENSALDQVVGE